MGNGHGGRRPGSGPKLGPDGKALKPYQRRDQSKSSSEVSRTPVIEAKVIGDIRQRPMFSAAAVEVMIEAMREMKTRSNSRPRTSQWNPYIMRPDRFGPVWGHLKSNKNAKRRLAMDDNSALTSANQFAVNAWQAGGLLPNDASEGLVFLGYPYLAELAQRPEFRLFGEIMSEEMTRKWIEYRGTDDESTKENKKPKERNKDDDEADQRKETNGKKGRTDARNKEIERKIVELKQFGEELGLRRVFKTVAAHNSDFGIAHLYLDLKNANIDDPRDPENRKSIGNGRSELTKTKLGKNCLQGLRTIEPVWCYPTAYNASNPLAPDWYDPLVWYVMGTEIHKTRLLPFIGRPVSDILKPAYAFGGLSMTQMAQPYVDIWLRTRESVGEIIHAFSVMILSTNMGTLTQPGGAGGANGDVMARMMMANMLRDNQGMMVIDKATEDFKNISAPISGLDELQAQSQEHLLSVSRIPAVKYTGNQPKGLNATSEGEMRAFNDTVHGQQEHLYRVGLTSITDIMQISLWGERDPDITFEFLPLHEETLKEKAEVRKLEAETDQIRVDTGLVSTEEGRAKLVADPESGYHGLDPDDVPDLLEEEEEGLIPEGAGKGLEAELANAKPGAKKPPGGAGKVGKPPSGEDEAEDVDFTLFDGAMDDGWNEADHPRGQPHNAGQFGPGGAGGSSKRGKERQMGEREGRRGRQMGEKSAKGGAGARIETGGHRQMAQASKLYSAPTKTADQIVASFPGAVEAIEKTRKRLAAAVPTDALVSEGGYRNPDGTYTPEREKLHREIAMSFFAPEKVARALPAPGEKPVLTMLGGRGGSGKSWLTGEHGPVDESKAILVDSDAIKGMLPGYEGWNASSFHEESTHILNMVDQRMLELGVNAIHDATMKSEATAAMRMAQYEAAGYEVEGYYMYAAPETAATRALSRYSKKGTFTGRFVPPEIILGNVNNEKNFDKLSGGFRKWAVYDNNSSEGPKLVSKSGD